MRRFFRCYPAALALCAACRGTAAPHDASRPETAASPVRVDAAVAAPCTPDGPMRGRVARLAAPDAVLALGLWVAPDGPPTQGLLVALTAEELLATTRWSEAPHALGLRGARTAPRSALELQRNAQGIFYVPLLRPGPPVPPQLVFAALDADAQRAQEPPALTLDDGESELAVHTAVGGLEAAWATEGAVALRPVGSEVPRQLVPAGVGIHALSLASLGADTLLAWSDVQDSRPVLRLAARVAQGPLRPFNVAPLPAAISQLRLLVTGLRVLAVVLEQGAAGSPVAVWVSSYRALPPSPSDARGPFAIEREHDYVELGRAAAGGALLARLEGDELQVLTHVAAESGAFSLQMLRLDAGSLRPLAPRALVLEAAPGPPGPAVWQRSAEGTVLALAHGRELTVARFDARGCVP